MIGVLTERCLKCVSFRLITLVRYLLVCCWLSPVKFIGIYWTELEAALQHFFLFFFFPGCGIERLLCIL